MTSTHSAKKKAGEPRVRMSQGPDAHREALIAQFSTITGATPERARFYLEAAAWDFAMATNTFFDEDSHENAEVREREPVEETGQGPGQDELVPAVQDPDDLPPVPQPLPPAKRELGTAHSPQFQSLRRVYGDCSPKSVNHSSSHAFACKVPVHPCSTLIASMADYQRRKREEEEGRAGKGKEGDSQEFFAGGSEHSGQMISGPPRKKVDAKELASDVFAAAKSQGARNVEEEEKEKVRERASAFRGVGFRLGDTVEPSEQIQSGPSARGPEKVTHTLTFWSNGFSVDNGPLRKGDTPEDKIFLKSVSKGEMPQELIRSARGGEVDINIEDNRNDEYVARAPKLVAFSGEGHKLGSIAPNLASHSLVAETTPTATPSSSASLSPPPTVPLDPAQPTTSIQIRLSDGSRLVAKFNPSHTVNDIRQFINLSRPAMSSAHYVLMTTFPNRELTDLSQSLADAKLLNAVVVQRMK
ncbi:NSFL1 cofactor p47 [Geodia barretti]|uniref:NSFL1 cofactor p47 n=1 Tax=Geodia barretti TaxID=519541 RepID=A0AA35WGX7_GEOBA|nr:NSFL1 cofactor p47 [Geodia barretti]